MTEIERGRPASRQRNGKWSKDKFSVPGYPMLLPTQLTDEQLKLYMRILRIEHISLKLRTNTYVPGSPERSPSPEPVYGLDGKRSNTRDLRYRKRFEDERHRLIEEAMKADALYRPPSDYKRPSKFVEKVWLPANEFPELNFIGLLIGPRGNTLKKMEAESGAKISIRGKGSAKEGSKPQPDEDQELHCQVTGDSNEKVQKAVKMIEDIVQKACSSPESENTLKQAQLRELAILNGTIKDDEIVCSNCGGVGHKRYSLISFRF
jgi:splicing factor 1